MNGFHPSRMKEVLVAKIESLGSQAQIISNKLDQLNIDSKTCSASVSEIKQMMSSIKNLMHELEIQLPKEQSAEIDAIWNSIFSDAYPVDVRFEREYYKVFSAYVSPGNPDFYADFTALVNGLDKKSVETVVLAIQRLKLIQNSIEPLMPLYSDEEKSMMRYLFEHFLSNILELSESCYFYRGYLLPINHFESCVFWDDCGLPYLEFPEWLVDKDIIDAGAFIGDSALIFAPLTSRKVYAFEPMPANYELLLKTIEMNALTNVVPCNLALGETLGKISISPSTSSNGSCSTQFKNDAFSYANTIEVQATTLDEFVNEHDLRVGLIKADVEGAEQLLLRGAMETIKTQKPALLISIYHNAGDFFGIKPWLDSLNLGYKFKIRHPVGGSVMTEMLLIAEAQ